MKGEVVILMLVSVLLLILVVTMGKGENEQFTTDDGTFINSRGDTCGSSCVAEFGMNNPTRPCCTAGMNGPDPARR